MITIEIPERVYEILKTIAKRRGKSINELVLESIVKEFDSKTRIEVYLELHNKYLKEAEELYGKGELAQSSEKYWRAVVSLLSAIAEIKGLPHYSHRDFWEVIEIIVEETKNPEYSTLFRLAEGLHANFYHNFMRKESFEKHREETLRLIKMLEELI